MYDKPIKVTIENIKRNIENFRNCILCFTSLIMIEISIAIAGTKNQKIGKISSENSEEGNARSE